MSKVAMMALAAAGMFVGLSLAAAPASAAPLGSGIAQSVLDDHGPIEKAACWRYGWHGPGWYPCRYWGPRPYYRRYWRARPYYRGWGYRRW